MKTLTTAILAAATLATAATVATPAMAQRGWETIGSMRVNHRVENGEIMVRGRERFTAIRLCAVGKDIRILDMDVRYANGGSQDVPNRNTVRAGRCSPAYDLTGARRNITSVKIAYAKMGVRGRDPMLTVQAR